MKVIFLDIDGVLNTDRAIRLQQLHNNSSIDFDKEAMENLKTIIDKTGAKIVVSSSWRVCYQTEEPLWKELVRNFGEYGLHDFIYSVTPILEIRNTHFRWKEIEKWIEENSSDVSSFVILDDEWEMGSYTKTNFVKCSSHNGITNEIKDMVIRILNHQNSKKN